jgi:chorismate synthase
MPQLRYLTTGESHGQCLIGVMEGLPAGLKVDLAGSIAIWCVGKKYSRGSRMKIETDQVEVLTGTRKEETIGVPVTLRKPPAGVDAKPL